VAAHAVGDYPEAQLFVGEDSILVVLSNPASVGDLEIAHRKSLLKSLAKCAFLVENATLVDCYVFWTTNVAARCESVFGQTDPAAQKYG